MTLGNANGHGGSQPLGYLYQNKRSVRGGGYSHSRQRCSSLTASPACWFRLLLVRCSLKVLSWLNCAGIPINSRSRFMPIPSVNLWPKLIERKPWSLIVSHKNRAGVQK